MGKVGKGQQRQCVGACLYSIKRDDIVDQAAAQQPFRTEFRLGMVTGRGLGAMLRERAQQFHRYSLGQAGGMERAKADRCESA